MTRTPDLIESGLRSIISVALGVEVLPGRLILGSTGLTINPDLVFAGSDAVGDVKYKFLDRHWARNDLYQSIAFATAYCCSRSLLVGFVAAREAQLPAAVTTGGITTTPVAWVAHAGQPPHESELQLQAGLRSWFGPNEPA